MSESVYKAYLSAYGQAATGAQVFLPVALTLQETTAGAKGAYDGKKGAEPKSRANVESEVTAALLVASAP